MRIAILGSGAVGGYYGGVLQRAGHDVRLLARGSQLATLRNHGLELHTPEDTFTVAVSATEDAAALGQVELAVVAVKSYSLPSIAEAAHRVARTGAVILPLLNGVDAADRLISLGVPRPQLLGGLTYISASRVAPGVVERRSSFQRVRVGELGGGLSSRAEAVATAFRGAGVDAAAVADIEVELWRKLLFLAALSAACGLARTAIGPVRAAPLGEALLERAVSEIAAVGRAHGVALAADEEEKTLALIHSLDPGLRPSFLADLEAGGATELDILSGGIARLGRELGVPTPVHDTATAALGVGKEV